MRAALRIVGAVVVLLTAAERANALELDAPAPGLAWGRLLGALALGLFLAVIAIMVLRRSLHGAVPASTRANLPRWPLGAPAKKRLQVQEVRLATPQLALCLVTCDGKEYLLASTPNTVVVLNSIPAGDGQ